MIGSRGSTWRMLSRTAGVRAFGEPTVRTANVAERNGSLDGGAEHRRQRYASQVPLAGVPDDRQGAAAIRAAIEGRHELAFRSKGRPGDIAVVDEAAFIDDLDEVLKAAMAFRIWGGTVHILSTHNGEAPPFNRLVNAIKEGERPGRFHTVTFDEAVADGLARRCMEVVGEAWSPEIEAAWIEQVRAEYGDDAAEELDCVSAAGAGAWLSWEQIKKIEHEQAGDPRRYAGGRTVIGNDIARWRHLWVACVLELVGDCRMDAGGGRTAEQELRLAGRHPRRARRAVPAEPDRHGPDRHGREAGGGRPAPLRGVASRRRADAACRAA